MKNQRKKVIKHYKAYFGIQDIPFRMLGKQDKIVIEWGEQLVNDLNMDKTWDDKPMPVIKVNQPLKTFGC